MGQLQLWSEALSQSLGRYPRIRNILTDQLHIACIVVFCPVVVCICLGVSSWTVHTHTRMRFVMDELRSESKIRRVANLDRSTQERPVVAGKCRRALVGLGHLAP